MNEKEYRKKIEELTKKYFKNMQLEMQRYANELAKLNFEYYRESK